MEHPDRMPCPNCDAEGETLELQMVGGGVGYYRCTACEFEDERWPIEPGRSQ